MGVVSAFSEPTLWDQTGGPVSDAHPLTSHRAASTVRSGSQKAQILLAMYAVWPDGGYTGYDLATSGLVVNGAGNPISANQTCTRSDPTIPPPSTGCTSRSQRTRSAT